MEVQDVAKMFELKKKKKKKKKGKKKKRSTDKRSCADGSCADGVTCDYSYELLLTRLMDNIKENHPDISEKKRHVMNPPKLMLLGKKKTLWINFQETCGKLGRSYNHVKQYFLEELRTDGSIDGRNRLVIQGKFLSKQIESILRKYIVEYVMCKGCRSPQTTLIREQKLDFVKCQNCTSMRSVKVICSGSHETTRC